MELTERKKQILKVVVEAYIRTAEPVGSKAIASEMGGSVSSATIRNELADLVELGYLEQPHTSAGRVPSPQGYRLYVNELMAQQRLSLQETEEINRSLRGRMEELDRLLSQVGRAVSSFVSYPAYAAAANRTVQSARRFELLPVDEHSCIAVLMMSGSRVKSQLLRLQLKVDVDQLPMLVNLLNTHFTGVSVDEMNTVEAGRREIITTGANQLLKLPEFQDAGKAHELMSFLADSKENLPLPDDGPMKILIGPENVTDALKDASVVVASYDIGDDMRGLIGVVGPTRMDYAAVAARLTGFAEGLTRLFGKELPPKEEPKK